MGEPAILKAREYWEANAPALIVEMKRLNDQNTDLNYKLASLNQTSETLLHRVSMAWHKAMDMPRLQTQTRKNTQQLFDISVRLNKLAGDTVLKLLDDNSEQRAVFLEAMSRKSKATNVEQFYADGLKWIVELEGKATDVHTRYEGMLTQMGSDTSRIDKAYAINKLKDMGYGDIAFGKLKGDMEEFSDYIEDGMEEEGLVSYTEKQLYKEIVLYRDMLRSALKNTDPHVRMDSAKVFRNLLLPSANRIKFLHDQARRDTVDASQCALETAREVLGKIDGLAFHQAFIDDVMQFMEPVNIDNIPGKRPPKPFMQIKA